jgi:hypothetical protein
MDAVEDDSGTQDEREEAAWIEEVTKDWPWVLRKACSDSWYYACRLRSGEVIHFESAEPSNPYYVRLNGVRFLRGDPGELEVCGYGRGLEVRVDQIAWIVDGDS